MYIFLLPANFVGKLEKSSTLAYRPRVTGSTAVGDKLIFMMISHLTVIFYICFYSSKFLFKFKQNNISYNFYKYVRRFSNFS